MTESEINKLVQRVIIVGIVLTAVILVAVSIFVLRSDAARQHNCQVTKAALHGFADDLGGVSGSEKDPRLAELHRRTERRMSDCK